MISISDAIPVQFWLNGIQSFNNKIEPGIEHHRFFQLFNADDEIKLQFTDSEELDYRLTIYDCDGGELVELTFTVELVGEEYVYSLTFSPEDSGITNQKIRLEIQTAVVTYEISGDIIDTIGEIVSGELELSVTLSISGDVTDTLGELVDGDIVNLEVTDTEALFYDDPEDCVGSVSNTVYYTGAFAPGTILYQDAALTTPWTGWHYVSILSGDGSVFELNHITGVIGDDTGFECFG